MTREKVGRDALVTRGQKLRIFMGFPWTSDCDLEPAEKWRKNRELKSCRKQYQKIYEKPSRESQPAEKNFGFPGNRDARGLRLRVAPQWCNSFTSRKINNICGKMKVFNRNGLLFEYRPAGPINGNGVRTLDLTGIRPRKS